ncbi:MAG: hypothetical protein ACPGD8_06375, partial [Flavobacteriales bacterium]
KGETRDVKVYAEVYCQLHEHPMQLMIDPNYDLTQIEYKNQAYFGELQWINQFDENAKPIDFEFLEEFKTGEGTYK